jgi:hypothetical protein
MSSKGLMLMLDGPPKGKGASKSLASKPGDMSDDMADDDADDGGDDYADDLGDPAGDEPPVDFAMHAETALGTSDPVKIKALHDAMRSLIDSDAPPPLPDEGGDLA